MNLEILAIQIDLQLELGNNLFLLLQIGVVTRIVRLDCGEASVESFILPQLLQGQIELLLCEKELRQYQSELFLLRATGHRIKQRGLNLPNVSLPEQLGSWYTRSLLHQLMGIEQVTMGFDKRQIPFHGIRVLGQPPPGMTNDQIRQRHYLTLNFRAAAAKCPQKHGIPRRDRRANTSRRIDTASQRRATSAMGDTSPTARRLNTVLAPQDRAVSVSRT